MDLTEIVRWQDAEKNCAEDGADPMSGLVSPGPEGQETTPLIRNTSQKYKEPDFAALGRNVSLALSCMDAAERFRDRKTSIDSDPNDKSLQGHTRQRSVNALSVQLRNLSSEIDSHRAELLELLTQFDDQQGWAEAGARSCADWANHHLGIAKASAYEYLHAGRELRELPIIRALFRGGELSWSKVRLLVRVADSDNERELAHVSLDATVADVNRLCKAFRWKRAEQLAMDCADDNQDATTPARTAEEFAADQQFRQRAVTWRELLNGSTELRITLPPEKAQAVLKSLEHCENELYEGQVNNNTDAVNEAVITDRPTPTQRRADAMVLMAERSLQFAGTDISRADRYQVVLHIDKNELQHDRNNLPVDKNNTQIGSEILHVHNLSTACEHSPEADSDSATSSDHSCTYPSKRPWVEGAGPIAHNVARRISCDCALVGMLFNDGEPLSVGRKTRIWPAAIARAITTRDRHCQFNGCNEHRHLEIHHIKHWADGGETSVDNGLCLCHRHHALVHEGGYRIEKTIPERISRAEKALMPTRHRFRFVRPFIEPCATGSFDSTGDKRQPCINHSTCSEERAHYRVPDDVNLTTALISIDLRPGALVAA